MAGKVAAAAVGGGVSSLLPGWVLIVALATASYALTGLLANSLGNESPVEPVALAIIGGLLLRNTRWVPLACDTGVKTYEVALKAGIVLLGLSLTRYRGTGVKVLKRVETSVTADRAAYARRGEHRNTMLGCAGRSDRWRRK